MDLGKKMISVEQALSLVKSNDHIVSALAPAEGAAFLGSLHTIADRVKNSHAKRQRQSRAAAAFHGGIETSLSSEMQYIYRQLLYA